MASPIAGPTTGSDAEGERALARAAAEAQALAYAPYSRFRVGAAVRARDGRVFTGANVENASYGLTVCAERSAVLAAVLAGVRDLAAVAVATDASPPAAPCGLCRQTLAEFADDDCEVLLLGPGGAEVRTRLGDLLPRAFRPTALGIHPTPPPSDAAAAVPPGGGAHGPAQD